MRSTALRRYLPSLLLFASLLAAWQLAVSVFRIREYLLPGPWAVLRAAVGTAVCQPCVCANTAISATSLAEYEADHRARRSQCAPSEGVVCGPCDPGKPVCEIQPDALTGTCKLVAGF